MENNSGGSWSNAPADGVFMPEDLPPEPSLPAPVGGAGSPIGVDAIRRKVLTGIDELGRPIDFGSATYALMEAGMRDGVIGFACSTDGLIALYTSHNQTSQDLRNAAPHIGATASEFISSIEAAARWLQPNQNADWPMPRVARFWLRQNGVVKGITATAKNTENPMMPWLRITNLYQTMLSAATTSTPASAATAPPANVRAVALRRGILSGAGPDGQPAAPGAGVAALVDLGINGGCVTVATFLSGEVLLILYQNGQGLDLGLKASSPQIASAAQQLVRGTAALPEQLRWTDRTDYPIPGEARFYRPTPQGIRSTSIPSLAVRGPEIGAAGAFAATLSLVKVYPPAFAAVMAEFPVPDAR